MSKVVQIYKLLLPIFNKLDNESSTSNVGLLDRAIIELNNTSIIRETSVVL